MVLPVSAKYVASTSPAVTVDHWKVSSHIFVFQAAEYVQATKDASGIEAGGQLGTTADLSVELFEFEIAVPIDNVFGLVMEVVNAEIRFFHFR